MEESRQAQPRLRAQFSLGDAEFDSALRDLGNSTRIDIHKLEGECADQPELYETAARLQTMARIEYTRAQLRRDQVKAEVASSIRRDPVSFDITKITEGTVSENVTTSAEVRQAEDEVIQAEEAYRLATGVLGAMEQRRSMLSALVDLYVHNYYMETDGGKTPMSDSARDKIMDKIREARKEE